MEYTILLSVFVIGLLVKTVDLMVDDGLSLRHKYFGHFLGVAYGLLIGYVISYESVLSSIAFAVVVAVIVTKKADGMQHALGIASMLLVVGILGMPAVNAPLLLIFLAGGIVDEILDGFSARKRFSGWKRFYCSNRLTTEIVTFAVSAVTGIWVIFIAMMLFDVGYLIAEKTGIRYMKHRI